MRTQCPEPFIYYIFQDYPEDSMENIEYKKY